MDDLEFAKELIFIIKRAKERLNPGGKFSSSFEDALIFCQKAANGEETKSNLEQIDRAISDWLPWDENFVGEYNKLKRPPPQNLWVGGSEK